MPEWKLKHVTEVSQGLARMRVPKLVKNGFYSSFAPLSLVRACLMASLGRVEG